MGTKPRKWPSYALTALENTQAIQDQIRETAKAAQEAMDKGHYLKAAILLGDIRDAASKVVNLLVQARAGDYRNE